MKWFYRSALAVVLTILLFGSFSLNVHSTAAQPDPEPHKAQSIDSGATLAAPISESIIPRNTVQRIRNVLAGIALVIIAAWIGIWLWRKKVLGHISRAMRVCGAYLRPLHHRLHQQPHTIFQVMALASFAGGVFFINRAWEESLRLGVRSIYLWEYAFTATGLLATAILFAVYTLWSKRNPKITAFDKEYEPAPRGWILPSLLCLGCVAVLGTFRWLDLWNSGFDEPSWRYAAYTVLRIAFMAYFVSALIGTGRWTLALIERQWGRLALGRTDRTLAAFFSGAATWYILLFPLGFFGLLQPYIVIPLFVSAVWFAWPLIADSIREIRGRIPRELSLENNIRLLLIGLPLGVLIPLWLHILVTQGLAINGFGYDSSGHYLPYYQAVVTSGSTGINEPWYHFWVSKGAGLHFVATMLTDIQGAQLVSFAFLTITVITLIMLVHRISGRVALGISAAAIFLAPFVYTFAYYQKLHIVTTALVGGMLWWMTQAWLRGTLNKPPNVVFLGLLALATVLHTPPLAALICPFLAISMWIARRFAKGNNHYPRWISAIPAAMAALGICLVLIVNFAKTGLMEVTPFRLFWNLANQSAFSAHVSPYIMLFADEGTSPATGKAALVDVFEPLRLAHLLHMQFLPQLLLITSLVLLCICLLVCLFDRKLRHLMAGAILPASLLIATAAALAVLVRQPGSIDRFYVFVLFPLVVVSVGVPGIVIRRLEALQLNGRIVHVKNFSVILLVGTVVGFSGFTAANWTTSYFHSTNLSALASKVRFALGNSTFMDTLIEKRQPTEPGHWPKGEISETCLGIRSAFQPTNGAANTWPKVWTMTFLQESGCHILPGVRIMMEFSNRFGKDWHHIVFADAVNAEAALDHIGIRYVFVDLGERNETLKTGESTSIFGCLAYSPLMDPNTLESKFRVTWNKGDAYLLTLASKGNGSPLPPGFAAKFDARRSAPQVGLGDMRGICHRLADYYRTFGERWPVHTDPLLPKLQGWQ